MKTLNVMLSDSGYDVKLHPGAPLGMDSTPIAPCQRYGEAMVMQVVDREGGRLHVFS